MSAPASENEPQGSDMPPDTKPNQNFDSHRPPGRGFRGRGRGGFNRGFNNSRGRKNFDRSRPLKDEGEGGRPGNDRDPNDFKEMRFQDKLNEKLASIGGPTVDLPSLETTEKKFSGRNRLYIGNVSPEAGEDDLKELLGQFGECAELFLNKEKNFAFVKYDYYANCEKAKRELDGQVLKGKNLKIRLAPNNATVKVKNLSDFVSNELLHHAFQIFGEIEHAHVSVDERGKATGEGIVEFARKGCAMNAIRKCTERCFFLTESLRPVVVEPYEFVNDTDGLPEKYLPKRNPDYLKLRSKGPRLAEVSSFEHEYGMRWKQLLELYAQKEDALKKELHMEKEKLEAQMVFARYEHETKMLREELRARELDRDRQKQEWEMKERQVEEQRRRNEEQIRRQEETMQARMLHQEEEMRRRQQENNLFMQAHQLHNMLDEQEQSFQSPEEGGNREGFQEQPHEERGGSNFRRERWITERRDDFAPKRRRF